jgi:hypothetical protein
VSHERSLWVVTPIPHRAEWAGHHNLGGARASEKSFGKTSPNKMFI